MSFFSGAKVKDGSAVPKSQFYVEFLGWMECRGVRGAHYTDPVIRELKQRQKHVVKPPKLTIQVSKNDLRITQEVDEAKKKGIKKIKFPTIPARDITYVRQGRHMDGRPDDVVACIYLGYMPRTQKFVHVHVYRFDEAATATTFARQLSAVVEANYQRVQDVESDLIEKGEIEDLGVHSPASDPHADDSAVGSASSAFSDDEPPNLGSDDIDPDLQSLKDVMPFDNVTEELRFRLQMGDTPLLLPPKDYDTISRAHGKLDRVKERRCLNVHIVGPNAIVEDPENKDAFGSNESGVDTASPVSDAADGSEKQQNVSAASPKPLQKRGSVKESKPSLAEPNSLKLDMSSKGSHHSGSTSSASPPTSGKNFVYPPKARSPPTSPRLYRSQAPREKIVKQTSLNSYLSDPAKQAPPRSNGYPEEKPSHYYPNSATDDVYALPKKAPKSFSTSTYPHEDELPPDYDDDIEYNNNNGGQMSRSDPLYRQPRLMRNLSDERSRQEFPPSTGRAPEPRRADGYPGIQPQYKTNDQPNAHRFGRVNSTKK